MQQIWKNTAYSRNNAALLINSFKIITDYIARKVQFIFCIGILGLLYVKKKMLQRNIMHLVMPPLVRVFLLILLSVTKISCSVTPLASVTVESYILCAMLTVALSCVLVLRTALTVLKRCTQDWDMDGTDWNKTVMEILHSSLAVAEETHMQENMRAHTHTHTHTHTHKCT